MKHLTKTFILLVLLCTLALLTVVSALGCSKKQPESKEIKIGALLALTGSGANYGQSLQNGIDLAVERINNEGGIHGKKLKVIYEDSQTDAKTGVSAFNKLADIDHVPVVIGSISSVVLAVQPIADKKQIVLINSSAISPKIPERATDFLFSIMVSGAQEARFFASQYNTIHSNEPLSIIYSNNSSGIDTKETLIRELGALEGKLAIVEGYELNTTDFRTLLTKVRESKAKYGYIIAFSSGEFAMILNQAKEMGLGVQWYSYSGFETQETLALAGSSAENIIYSYPDYSSQKEQWDEFQQEYTKRFASWADIYTVTSYDGIILLAKIMQTSGTSSSQIQKGLREAGAFIGVFGTLKFADKQYVEKPLVWKTVKNGAYILKASSPK